MQKENIKKSIIAGLFSAITIGVLTLLTYKTQFGLFLISSFGSSMLLIFGYPESPFAQPKNIFFGHLLTTLIGMFFLLFNTFASLYNYSHLSWFRSWFNDFT